MCIVATARRRGETETGTERVVALDGVRGAAFSFPALMLAAFDWFRTGVFFVAEEGVELEVLPLPVPWSAFLSMAISAWAAASSRSLASIAASI